MPITRKRHRPSHAVVVAYLALFIALGGTSVAAVSLQRNSVKGKHIARNAITSPKVKNGSLRAADFRRGDLPVAAAGQNGAAGPPGPAGPDGPAGARGETGAAGAPGTARAYALVASNGALTAGKSKNVESVTRPFEGSYCVILPSSIDASTVEAVVSPNYVNAPFLPIAQINTDRSHCGSANAIKVQTSRVAQNVSSKDISEDPENSSFFIMVP